MRTRHHSIPTPDEAEPECRLYDSCTYFANTTSSLYTLSYLLTTIAAQIPQCAVRLRSPRARNRQPATASLSFDPTTHPPNTSSLPSQASSQLTLRPPLPRTRAALTACAFLPSPAAFDHTTTTIAATHRRSLSAVLTRPTACLLEAQPRDTQLSPVNPATTSDSLTD